MIVRTETIDQRIDTYLNDFQPDKIVVVVSETSEKLCLPKLQIYKKVDNIVDCVNMYIQLEIRRSKYVKTKCTTSCLTQFC